MKKKPIEVSIPELEEILDKYLKSDSSINFAVKIIGHPGVGKSAIVKQVAEKINYHFIDTRLAFKENIDLGGYPVPDHDQKRMIYFRPKFIPPETVPDGKDGIVWFLDEANRAHPTVIQTLFQVITEHTCGEHGLPNNTSIILAGNLGEGDSTTITEFDDSALDGRLSILHLKPDAGDWLRWAHRAEIHPSVTRYISIYPEKLWDEENIDPNPRGWHQVSEALKLSYEIYDEAELVGYLNDNPGTPLEKIILSLVGEIAGTDFITHQTAPREISTADIMSGNRTKLELVINNKVPAEDLLWALSGAISNLRNMNIMAGANLDNDGMKTLGKCTHLYWTLQG